MHLVQGATRRIPQGVYKAPLCKRRKRRARRATPCTSPLVQRIGMSTKKQQIISNSFSLLAFISLLTYPNIALIILSFSFLFLYVYERDLAKCSTDENRTSEYMAMRFWLTLIVISMHITAYILWFY